MITIQSMFKKVLFLVKKHYIKSITIISISLISFFMVVILSISEISLLKCLVYLMPQQELSGKNVLVYGIDNTKDSKRADSIMLFHINKKMKHIGVLSIPRDTLIKIPEIGETKINHTYAYHGVNLLKETISNLIGLDINNYIEVNLLLIKDVVDVMGGVEIDVNQHLYYKDLAGGINIDITKGKQNLDGENAVNYLRFRQDKEGDIGRIKRQQLFLQSFGAKFFDTSTIFKLPSIIKSFRKSINTDLSTFEMINLANELIDGLKNHYIHKTVIPGNIKYINGISYWKINNNKLEERIEAEFLGFKVNEFYKYENNTGNNYKELEDKLLLTEKQNKETNLKIKLLNSQNISYIQQIEDFEKEKYITKNSIKQLKKQNQNMSLTIKNLELEKIKNNQTINDLINENKSIKETQKILEKSNKLHSNKISKLEKQIESNKINQKKSEEIKNKEDETINLSEVRIEILNGCGDNGIAHKFAKNIKEFSIKVTRIDNAGNFNYQSTKLVDWKGDHIRTKLLAQKLNIDEKDIIVHNRPEKNLEFTLVIGHNWK